MKMHVVGYEGRHEVINVVGPVEIHHGEKMDHLHSADGMDHYFLHDGTYDGWGKSAVGMTAEEAVADIERIEREREIHNGPDSSRS